VAWYAHFASLHFRIPIPTFKNPLFGALGVKGSFRDWNEMSNLPSDELTTKLMETLIDSYKNSRIPVLEKSEIIKELKISESDFTILQRHFHNLLFTIRGNSQLQIDRDILLYERRMRHCTFNDVLQFFRGRKAAARRRRLIAILATQKKTNIPTIIIKSILDFGGKTDDGQLVKAVAAPWFDIMEMIKEDPESIYKIDCWDWEEIIAGAYKRQGFDEVILTPRSGDKGRDIVATRNDGCSIRIFDQVKAYKSGHLVPANDVRALVGVLSGAQNVSKGVITTTSYFAPKIESDDYIKPFLPYRLELKPKNVLLPWLQSLSESES